MLDARLFTLLRFPAQDATSAVEISDHPLLRVVTLGRPGQPQAGAAGWVEDPDGQVHAAYSGPAGALYLIRPDGHVCWRWTQSDDVDSAAIEQAILRASGWQNENQGAKDAG
ncbi:FAD-dependent oxidoreductase [compost metagenome]